MAQRSTKNKITAERLHWARFLAAIFAVLISATHLASAIPSGSFASGPSAAPANAVAVHRSPSFNFTGFWIEFEVIVYIVIAIVFLLGLRTWYVPAVAFNIFNIAVFFLSGAIAIPGITTMAFGSRFAVFSSFSVMSILVASWALLLIISLALLKFDPGSELDRLLVTRKG
ncbi:MAG TPA: hypothetical protein VL944_03340 [Candidatus Acidoferrum sp.]|nr:hypothetical protein [Candidatus Acidoferrum sp.]